ncbi:magnesium transporter [Methyloceanibacter caenitepidi]|uniref:magnesium transporter n=1 Tax=Methyloceanibacter caenitepidi TaxID=1384459 RepID=UPI00155A1A26|nr:magnesium transporter [Methyloceanibacter caenitepidi]
MAESDSALDLKWVPEDEGAADGANDAVVGAIRQLIRDKNKKAVRKVLAHWPPENIMELLVRLPLKAARKLLEILPDQTSSRVLSELRPQYRAAITRDETVERLRELIRRMPPENALDTFRDLPDDVQDRLGPDLKSFEGIQASRAFEKESAGEIMQRRHVALAPDRSAAEAVEALQRASDMIGSVDTVFVIDADNRPIGAFKPRALLLVPPDTPLSKIMSREFPIVSSATDQEEAALATAGTEFKSLPVVDNDGRLVGQITTKMLARVVAEEAAEDMLKLGGVNEDARPTDSVPKILRNRLPWLLAGLVGATIAALIIGSFEEELEKAAILAAFIPVVMSMAGNAGLQASVVSVQALAMGSNWPGDRLIYRFGRELLGALLNGAIAGSILASLILGGSLVFEVADPVRLALATSMSLLTVTTIAAIVGSFVPLALNRLGIDPAAATGVFITTSNDVVGVLVYFLMASTFYF